MTASVIPTQTAVVQEIFSGIQGEGVLVGYRQIFVRFHGCHLACRYCDTPASRAAPPPVCRQETHAGDRDFHTQPNPLTVPDIMAAVEMLQRNFTHHSVSLTGGEPLLRYAFLNHLLPAMHTIGLRTYLETNGALPEAMAHLTEAPCYMAMDIKLPTTAGITPWWEEHAAFLDAALACILRDTTWQGMTIPHRLHVKVVFCEESLAEVERAAALVAARRTDIPLILQPVTPLLNGPTPPTPATVLEAQRIAAAYLTRARVIPQTHVMLRQL